MNVLLKAFRVIYEWRYRCATQIVRTTHRVKRKRTKIKKNNSLKEESKISKPANLLWMCMRNCRRWNGTKMQTTRTRISGITRSKAVLYIFTSSVVHVSLWWQIRVIFFSVCLEIFWRSFYLLISHPLHIFILLYLMASHKYRRRRQADMTAISWEMHRTSLRENWSNYFECCWRSQRWRLSVLYKTRIHWDYWFIDAYKPVAGISQVYDTRFSMIYRKSTKRLN